MTRTASQRPKPVVGLPARRGALRLLTSILWQQRPLDGALDHALQGITASEDRALARTIASHTLRWLGRWDALIDTATRKRLPDDARARMVLRLALTQILILKLPPHAVIATCLPLVEGGPRRLVHGVLSQILKNPIDIDASPPPLPFVFNEAWAAAYGATASEALAAAGREEPPLDLTLRDPATTQHWVDLLEGSSLMPGHVRLTDAGRVAERPGFAEGHWWVQDLAAQLPARLLAPQVGEQVLDLCAAPGGKTLQMASTGAQVTAVDDDPRRVKLLNDNLSRVGVVAKVVTADVRHWQPPAAVDAILLDAPCSATGTYRRHPDVLHLRDPYQLEDVCAVQTTLLDRALGWLKPGGRLIYAVCSLEAEEGVAQITAALQRNPEIAILPILPNELPAALTSALTAAGFVQTLPSMLADQGGIDGFFIARLGWR